MVVENNVNYAVCCCHLFSFCSSSCVEEAMNRCLVDTVEIKRK